MENDLTKDLSGWRQLVIFKKMTHVKLMFLNKLSIK